MAGRERFLVWRRLSWPRPYRPEAALELLGHLAADARSRTVVFEARGCDHEIRYLVGVAPEALPSVQHVIASQVRGARVSVDSVRLTPHSAARVLVTHQSLALSTDRAASAARSVLAGLSATLPKDEEVILQVLLGPRVRPRLVPENAGNPQASVLDIITGRVRPPSAEAKAGMRSKAGAPGFRCVIRLGARAKTKARERELIFGLFSGMKVAESAGATLRLDPDSSEALAQGRAPWRWPLTLSAPELVSLIGWPLGEGALPGVGGEHPKVLSPSEGLKDSDRPFAVSAALGPKLKLGIPIRDSLQHTVLLGPTGSGKSNVMLNMISADIAAGRSVLLLDPKSDLTFDVLARVPRSRHKDVVVIDPSDSRPVGINPLASRHQNPSLITDGILAVFKELYASSWGPRTQDILTGALLTLAQNPDSSLVWLPTLLTDARFRRKLTANLRDPVGLGPFWAAYEAMSAPQREQVIAPVMNKLRQFVLRPALRSVLGQSRPAFDLADLLTQRKIVLISLNKGLTGSESARLLGSLVVAELWPLILSRAKVPPERRHVVGVFIDEVQDYLALPTDLGDALSQARGLGVGLTLAHQHRNQLPPALRAGVDANARNKVVFGLTSADAREMAAMAPELDAEDFMLLPRFDVYAHLLNDGHSTGWVSGQTLPPVPAVTDAAEVKAESAVRYGRSIEQVEAELFEAIDLKAVAGDAEEEGGSVGRRRRRPS